MPAGYTFTATVLSGRLQIINTLLNTNVRIGLITNVSGAKLPGVPRLAAYCRFSRATRGQVGNSMRVLLQNETHHCGHV